MDPNNKPSRLEHQQRSTEEQQSEQRQSERMFETPEELIRLDAQHTPLPPTIAVRLEKSLAAEPPVPANPWWRRLFAR